MNSNLIPTARTDKNGRTVIRHMKPEEATGARASGIPAVQLSAPQSPQEQINEIATLISGPEDGMDFPELAMYLGYLEENNSKTLPILKRCLTSGSDEAQETVKSIVWNLVETIRENIDSSSGDSESEDEYGDQFSWTDNCPEVWYPASVSNALCFWNAINVAEEAGSPMSSIEVAYRVQEEADRADFNPRSYLEEGFWRGLTALTLSEVKAYELDAVQRKELDSFILWAGKHENIAVVTEIVSERRIINKDTLQGLIGERKNLASALKDGSL